jgi:hypothetical protein
MELRAESKQITPAGTRLQTSTLLWFSVISPSMQLYPHFSQNGEDKVLKGLQYSHSNNFSVLAS